MNGDKGPRCGQTREVMGEISQTGMKCNLDGGRMRGERFRGNHTSICLWRRRCQLLLGLCEWLPADMDLILHKSVPAK